MSADLRPATHVVGFVFSFDRARVLLIKKARPQWQAGLLNGIGGKVDAGETSRAAMEREAKEEAHIDSVVAQVNWLHVAQLDASHNNVVVDIFAAFNSVIDYAKAGTDEALRIVYVDQLRRERTLRNLPLHVAICLDESGMVLPVRLFDSAPEQPA